MNKLPEGITLQLYLAFPGVDSSSWEVLFSSTKKWLHPLFELEEFLASHTIEIINNKCTFEFGNGLKVSSSDLFLRDTVIGRAAAVLITRMGINRLGANLISRLAIPLLQEHSVQFEAIKTIDAIDCMTENLLKDYSDYEEAYAVLAERRVNALK
ncbi:MAG: DUF1893 domain-containing protein [Candidatus Riflemargulisbacteria bacterium]